jgi:hypothetical protein
MYPNFSPDMVSFAPLKNDNRYSIKSKEKEKMNTKHLVTVACAAAFCGGVWAADNSKAAVEVEEETSSLSDYVSIEAGLAIDSKWMYYGLVDNNDPILTPSACITFFDWVFVGFDAIFDLTPYGRKKIDGERVYTNRGGKYTEFDPYIGIAHAFSPEDCELLPTTVELSFDYCYEYHSKSMGRSKGSWGEPSQFVSLEVGLPDLWIEPTFLYERDIDRDNGTYLNLELGHTFSLIDGETEEDDPVLALRPSVAQGFGNSKRVYLYDDNDEHIDHGGLMDTCIKLELVWNFCEYLSLSGYVAYSDFLFDRQIRDAARNYESHGRWDESYNFFGGVAINFAF